MVNAKFMKVKPFKYALFSAVMNSFKFWQIPFNVENFPDISITCGFLITGNFKNVDIVASSLSVMFSGGKYDTDICDENS